MATVCLLVRRQKTSIYLDLKDTTPVLELKKMIEGILKVAPQNQQLSLASGVILEDQRTLGDYGLNPTTARPMSPATLRLAFRGGDGTFEVPIIVPYSEPPLRDYYV